MRYDYITLEREYGTGGDEAARKLGERLDIPVYGSAELLAIISEQTGIPAADIEEYEERATGSLLYSIVMLNRVVSGDPSLLSPEQKVFFYEQNLIRDLAAKGPAIFVGHCAGEILRKQGHNLNVFFYADDAFKNERIRTHYNIAERTVDSTRRAFDKKRSGYYNAYTGKKWSDPKNYDLQLNTSTLGIERCVETLETLIR